MYIKGINLKTLIALPRFFPRVQELYHNGFNIISDDPSKLSSSCKMPPLSLSLLCPKSSEYLHSGVQLRHTKSPSFFLIRLGNSRLHSLVENSHGNLLQGQVARTGLYICRNIWPQFGDRGSLHRFQTLRGLWSTGNLIGNKRE